MDIPVYLVAGFLDAGKTEFINGVLQDGFARQERTLLICCEEGELEYDPRVLENVTVVTVEDAEDLKCSQMKTWAKEYQPKHVADGASLPGGAARQLGALSDHDLCESRHL